MTAWTPVTILASEVVGHQPGKPRDPVGHVREPRTPRPPRSTVTGGAGRGAERKSPSAGTRPGTDIPLTRDNSTTQSADERCSGPHVADQCPSRPDTTGFGPLDKRECPRFPARWEWHRPAPVISSTCPARWESPVMGIAWHGVRPALRLSETVTRCGSLRTGASASSTSR